MKIRPLSVNIFFYWEIKINLKNSLIFHTIRKIYFFIKSKNLSELKNLHFSDLLKKKKTLCFKLSKLKLVYCYISYRNQKTSLFNSVVGFVFSISVLLFSSPFIFFFVSRFYQNDPVWTF